MRVIDIENIKLTSVNRKYTIARGKRQLILSPEYRTFKTAISRSARRVAEFTTPVRMKIFHSSRLDVDNPVKAIMDGLQDAGILANDRLVKSLIVEVDHKNEGRLTVDIEEMEE